MASVVVVVVGAAAVVSVTLADPAAAKGAESLTITGPGLDEPIEIDLAVTGSVRDDTPSYLVIALRELTYPDGVSAADLSPEAPPRPLKDRYTLTWQNSRPPDADPTDYAIVQDVYPDAFHIPVVRTRPDRFRAGGWIDAHPDLRETLAALGVPVSGLPVGRPTPADGAPEPALGLDPDPDPGPGLAWPVPVAASLGVAVGVGLGVALTRSLRRQAGPWPSGPAPQAPRAETRRS